METHEKKTSKAHKSSILFQLFGHKITGLTGQKRDLIPYRWGTSC